MHFLRVLLALLSFSILTGHAQNTPTTPDSAEAYHYTETMPIFPGGQRALLKLLTDDLQYPKQALRDQIAGRVLISFTVSPEGRTTDIKLKQGLRADVDTVALRAAQRLTRVQWQPGTQNGRPVSVVYTVPLNFGTRQNPGAAADSLDLAPGPAMVFPLSEWATSRKLLPPDKGVVYGSCLQRLGFSSGGFGQYVRLVNLDTHKAVRINVKPTFRSRQANPFCYALPPGRYALHSYEYTESKWYGGEMHIESLRKAAAPGATLAASRYIFTVVPGQLHYVGTWDFSEPKPIFVDNKAALDAGAGKLPVAEAMVALPK